MEWRVVDGMSGVQGTHQGAIVCSQRGRQQVADEVVVAAGRQVWIKRSVVSKVVG